MLRSVTVVYGFFFVLLSGIIVASPTLKVALDTEMLVLLFYLIIALAIACALIGLEILARLVEREVHGMGALGMAIMGITAPIVFVSILSGVLVPALQWFDYSATFIGIFVVGLTATVFYLGIMIRYMFLRETNKKENGAVTSPPDPAPKAKS